MIDSIIFSRNTAEASTVIKYLKECSSHFVPPLDTYVDISAYAEKLCRNAETLEAWYGSELVAMVAVYLNDQTRSAGYITHVSVQCRFQRRGLGLSLINQCIDIAQRKGFGRLCLEVFKDNAVAIQLYSSLGFCQGEECGNKIKMMRTLNADI